MSLNDDIRKALAEGQAQHKQLMQKLRTLLVDLDCNAVVMSDIVNMVNADDEIRAQQRAQPTPPVQVSLRYSKKNHITAVKLLDRAGQQLAELVLGDGEADAELRVAGQTFAVLPWIYRGGYLPADEVSIVEREEEKAVEAPPAPFSPSHYPVGVPEGE